MNIKFLAGSLTKLTYLAAIATLVSLFSVPAFAGEKGTKNSNSTSSSEMPTSTQAEPTPMEAPRTNTVPSGTTPSNTTTTPSSTTNAATPGTIVDIASSNASFKTLTAAVRAAGLADTLSGQGPYTVFAPTDAAFAALPQETVAMLMKPENKAKLQKVLAYHVVPGSVESSTLQPGQVETVEGSTISVKRAQGKVMVNNASVTTPDIKASNGVIHVIDKVILPPDL